MTVVHTILVVLEPDLHAAEDELERYSLGRLASEECARVEEHLLICETCRERLHEQDLILGSITSAAAEWTVERHEAEKKAGWRFPPLIPVLAATVVLVSGALWVGRPRLGRADPAVVALSTTRGTTVSAQAPPQKPLDLRPDFTGLATFPRYKLEVVDRLGGQIFTSQTTPEAAVHVPPLQSGAYFVRLYSPAGELLREYALEIGR